MNEQILALLDKQIEEYFASLEAGIVLEKLVRNIRKKNNN